MTRKGRRLTLIAVALAVVGVAAGLAPFAALVTLHVTSDFSVVNVFENSHSLKPLIYKITGVWGNHEGSMLLWVSILALFGGLVAAVRRNLPLSLRANVLAVQAWIAALLSLHPDHLEPVPAHRQSADRGPRPQSGAAGHRPRGPSADALSRLCRLLDLVFLRGRGADRRPDRRGLGALGAAVDAAGAWIFLTLGIAMGSYWAYYELGWGGWWFWDPVENASLMPWLAGTALLHSPW
jgi:cytochrome c-type biogenesis protein CcmF